MKRTRTLFSILLLLIALMLLYYTITHYEKVNSYFHKIINKYTKKTAIIPDYSKNHRIYLYEAVSETHNFEPQNIDDLKKIFFTVLNNGWDEFTFYCTDEYTNCITDIRKIANSKIDPFIGTINSYVSPYNAYKRYNTTIINNNQVKLEIDKLYTEEEIDKLKNKVDEIIKKLKINTTNPNKDDIKKIHNYLIENITYDEEKSESDIFTDSAKAIGALFNKKALCSGYSDAFALFMDELNIPNFEVTSEEHKWNAIYIDNGWYHVDVTWDDDEMNDFNTLNFFIITTNDLLSKDKKEHNFDKTQYVEFKKQNQ